MKKNLLCRLAEEKYFLRAPFNRLNFYWRLFATALGFSLFGGGSIVMGLTLFPLIILFTKDKRRRSDRVRSAISYAFRLYLSVIELLGVVKIKTKGFEHLQGMQSKLVICNHPSLLDVVIIMSRLKNIQCVVNNKLWRNPFVGIVVRAAGFIRNDTEPQFFLQQCKEMLARGENLVIFPEGTRSVPGQPMKLHRGVANLALCAEADVQALTLICNSVWLIKNVKWYEIPPKRAEFSLEVGPLFSHRNYCGDSPRSIRVRAFMRDIQLYYRNWSDPPGGTVWDLTKCRIKANFPNP